MGKKNKNKHKPFGFHIEHNFPRQTPQDIARELFGSLYVTYNNFGKEE